MITLEEGLRLSQTLIWKLQEDIYTQLGPEAWAIDNGVPSYITSNPFTAQQYAYIVLGYIQDHLSQLDLQEPLYIFDLGAGSGRFGYLFLKEVLSLLATAQLQHVPICYVMTDLAGKNLQFWQNHPLLQKYIQEEILDFTLYRHDDQKPLYLQLQQKHLKSTKNPLVLIANYYFDTIPQDLFRVKEGQLQEALATIKAPEEHRDLVNQLDISYRYHPIDADTYSNQLEINILLKEFSKSISEGMFTFPIGGLATLTYFESMSKGNLLLLAGDQGVANLAQVHASAEPKFCRHTSFSIDVCYPLLELYFKNKQGTAWIPKLSDPIFVNFTAVLGLTEKNAIQTSLAWHTHMNAFEPCDYWKVVMESHQKEQSLPFVLSLVKWGNGDPMPFHFFYDSIRSQAAHVPKEVLLETVARLLSNFYWIIPSDGNFVLNLGVLLFDLKEYKKALEYFHLAYRIMGDNKIILMNLGACYQILLDLPKAKYYFDKAAGSH